MAVDDELLGHQNRLVDLPILASVTTGCCCFLLHPDINSHDITL